jgi:hypothetical protein
MATLNNPDKAASTHAPGLLSSGRNGQVAPEQIPAQVGQQMQAATETALGMSSEMLRYAGQRLHAHAAHLQSLAGCTTPQSFMDQQMAFMSSSMQEYGEAVSKLIDAAQATSNVSTKQRS